MEWQKWDDYLTGVDGHVRARLKGVCLVSEARIPAKTSITALRGHVVMRNKMSAHGRAGFLYRHRLSLVVGVVGVARDLYEQGGLWPYIDHALMAQGHAKGLDEATRDDYRHTFIDTLCEFGLPTVGDGYELVDSAAMHAGIPTYCLDDWFNLTDRARRHVGDEPAEMTAWARASSTRPVMADIDKPIKTMLVHGPEFAADLFERAAELMDHLTAHYSTSELKSIGQAQIEDFAESGHSVLDEAQVIGLEPRWVVRAASNLSRDHRSSPRACSGKSPLATSPSLWLDFADGELQLTLPAIPDVQQPVHWEILVGNRRRSVVANLDTSGAFVSSEEITLPITSPIRVLTISTAGLPKEIPLWATGSPVAFFTQSGAHRPVSAGVITPGTYWALVPTGASFTSDGESIVIARDDAPVGWAGWDLAQVALRPGRRVEIGHEEGTFSLRVRGGESPQLLVPPPVEGARSFGMPVLAARPKVRIPDSSGTWRIAATRKGSDQPVWVHSVDQPGDYEVLAGIFGQAGTFEVTVRGPLGRGVKETFSLIDGLTITAMPVHRHLDAQGRLVPVTAAGGASVGVKLIPPAWNLGSQDTIKTVKVIARSGEHYSFVHRPSATLVGSADHQGIIRWAPRPARIDSATLSQSPDLLVRAPSATPPAVSAMAGGFVVQQLSCKHQLTAWRYRLGELAGAFEENGPLRLFLPDGQPVASVSARPTFRGTRLSAEGGAIELMEWSGQASEMEAWVWLEKAVWRAPALLPLQPGGKASLPDSHRGAGPLLLHVRPCDPWVPQDDPRLPVPFFRVDAPGCALYSPAEDAVVRVANGEPDAQLIPACASLLVDMWLGGRAALRHFDNGAPARLRAASVPIACELVNEAARRDLDRKETARVLVNSGVIHCLIEPDVVSARNLWETAPWMAGTMGMQWLLQEDEAMAEIMRRAALREFGDCLVEVLESGNDPYRSVGRFDAASVAFEAMPSDQAGALLEALGITPQAMLDRDSRADRIRRISQLRDNPDFTCIPTCKRLVFESEAALHRSGLGALVAEIRVLHPSNGSSKHHWLPPFARAAALIVRLGARGEPRVGRVSAAVFDALALLAEADPNLVLAELTRAEALLTALDHAETTRHSGGVAASTSRGNDQEVCP